MIVIAISGLAGSGKDTVGRLMADALKANGKRVLITHFADLLKYILREFFEWDGEKDERGRFLLQNVGTEIVKRQFPNYWADFIVGILKMFGSRWDYVIIPDLRFPDELSRLREAGFCVVHVEVFRPKLKSKLSNDARAHVSEMAMNGVIPDFRINNYGNIFQLKQTVVRLVKENLNDKQKRLL